MRLRQRPRGFYDRQKLPFQRMTVAGHPHGVGTTVEALGSFRVLQVGHIVVEYWGGKATGWQPYDEVVQGILLAARAAGKSRVEVQSGGRDYIICMETMQQWRKPWQSNYNARQIRFNTGATV